MEELVPSSGSLMILPGIIVDILAQGWTCVPCGSTDGQYEAVWLARCGTGRLRSVWCWVLVWPVTWVQRALRLSSRKRCLDRSKAAHRRARRRRRLAPRAGAQWCYRACPTIIG